MNIHSRIPNEDMIGRTHHLRVTAKQPSGYLLDALSLGELFLPVRQAPKTLTVGEKVEVFLYLDSRDRPAVTTRTPRIRLGEFALLKVVDVNNNGAFMDWGLDKDLLVPFAEQHHKMQPGKSYLVHLYRNKADGRLVASSKLDRFLEEDGRYRYKPGQAVDLIIANSTELGFRAIVNQRHWGLLFRDEVFQRLSYGQSIRGYIKRIRKDGKLDLTLQAGQQSRDEYAERIVDYLRQHGGFAPLHDKSEPGEISRVFGISKSAFKKTIGHLYKQRRISIEENGIRLAENGSGHN